MDVRRATTNQQIAALCGLMFWRFGGPEGFASAWWEHFEAAPRGSMRACNFLFAVNRLTELADVERQREEAEERTSSEYFTEEEIRARMNQLIANSMPELAAAAGMKLVPIDQPT